MLLHTERSSVTVAFLRGERELLLFFFCFACISSTNAFFKYRLIRINNNSKCVISKFNYSIHIQLAISFGFASAMMTHDDDEFNKAKLSNTLDMKQLRI